MTPLSFRMMHNGKRRTVTTGTPDLALAKARAKQLIDDIHVFGWDSYQTAHVERNRHVPTIGEVVDFLKHEADQFALSATVTNYANSLMRVVEVGHGKSKDWVLKQSLDVLTESLAVEYIKTKQGAGRINYVAPMKINTTINSMLRQAKAVFSRRARAAYDKKGWEMPDTLNGFLRVSKLREVSHRYSDNPISPETFAEIDAALPALRERDERLYFIHLMLRLMGMRNSEVVRARRHWLVSRTVKGDSRKALVITARHGEDAPKRSDREILVPRAIEEYFLSHDNEHLIPAENHTERKRLVGKGHSTWLRAFLPGRTKTNHELRKHAGSVIATRTNSYERAAEFLGDDIETAKENYLAFLDMTESIEMEDEITLPKP